MKQLNADINLVICQKSKVNDWVEHFNEHYFDIDWDRNQNIICYNLTDKKDFDTFMNVQSMTNHFKIVGIINYELAFRRPELSKLENFTLMLDESSLIQNETAKRSRFILKKLQPDNVILLSGTPTGGKYERLWSQCKLLGWDITKQCYWNTFVNYEIDRSFGFPMTKIYGYKNVERLKRKLREHGAVFMKSDEVLKLPMQSNYSISVQPCKEYRQFQKNSIVMYEGKEYVGDTTLTKLLYERMLCGFSKKQAFRDLLNSTSDRLIVFYNFNDELNMMLKICADCDKPVSIVNGQMKDLSTYETDENSVTLIQYQAGAMGLNLQKANKILYFTPPLSSELFEQSKKRIHRLGQERPCFYYYLTCNNSVEERIYKTLELRRDYTNALFEKGE